jgi:hypothetical protein
MVRDYWAALLLAAIMAGEWQQQHCKQQQCKQQQQ